MFDVPKFILVKKFKLFAKVEINFRGRSKKKKMYIKWFCIKNQAFRLRIFYFSFFSGCYNFIPHFVPNRVQSVVAINCTTEDWFSSTDSCDIWILSVAVRGKKAEENVSVMEEEEGEEKKIIIVIICSENFEVSVILTTYWHITKDIRWQLLQRITTQIQIFQFAQHKKDTLH